MPRNPLTAETLWTLPRVGNPEPSPDGARVVVPVSTANLETDEQTTRLWLVPADARGAGHGGRGDSARPLTTADVSTSQPAWSPDGTRLAFVRKPGEAQGREHGDRGQLYVMPLDGGDPERLTDLPFGVVGPRWFPDGRRIAFVSEVYADGPDLEATAKRAKEVDDAPVKAAVTEDRWYRLWDRWLTHGRVHHVFVLDVETREVTDLTPDIAQRLHPQEPAADLRIAPDGREIAFFACRSGSPYDELIWGIYLLKVPGPRGRPGKPRCLTSWTTGSADQPEYSPDGRWIVFGMRKETTFYADRVRLVAVDRRTREHRVLTEDWDRSAAAWRFVDERTLVVLAEDEARTALYRLDLPRALRSPKRNPPRRIVRGGWYGAPQVAGGHVFANLSSLREPPEVVRVDLETGRSARVTGFTKPVARTLDLGAVREVTFEGAEGDPVRMWICLPPGVKAPAKGETLRRRPPLVHLIHGGPHGVFGDQWHWRWNAQAFAAPGYVVAMVNFHGSTGRGQEYAASILGRWGDQPYEDILKGTDDLVAKGWVNRNRVAVTGGSYGGYLVSWIASQTDRFSCIVNHAGVADFQTQFASDVTQGRARSMGGSPWENRDGMDRYNPMRHAGGFRTPMLVLHGEKDYRVPYVQGLEIYAVYKAMGLPARLVVYPDENHWILKPGNSLHWYGEVLGWLKRWLRAGR